MYTRRISIFVDPHIKFKKGQYMISRKRWTKDELKKLMELKEQNKDTNTICRILGRTQYSVKTKMCTYGLNNNDSVQKSLEDKIEKMWFKDKLDIYQIATVLKTYPLKVSDIVRKLTLKAHINGDKAKDIRDIIGFTADNEDAGVFYWDKKHPEKDMDQLIQLYDDMRKEVNKYELNQSEITGQINTQLDWILLVITGDYHIGSMATDIKAIQSDMNLIKNTPGAYYAMVGDGTDNFVKGIGIDAHEQILSPKTARKMFSHLIKIVQDKLLFLVHGCHDDFSIRIDDYNLIEDIAEETGCAYLGYGGKLNLLINNDTLYQIAAWHKRKANSMYNMFHPCITYLQRHDMNCDIVCVAHNHVTGITDQIFQERQRIFIRTGVYKTTDRFSRKLGFKSITNQEPDHIVPCILLNTNKKEMRTASSIEEGIDMLKIFNGSGHNNEIKTETKKSGPEQKPSKTKK